MKLKSYAAQTDQGPYLQVNEDTYDFDFENDLFVILDGFGGSGIGDRAVDVLKNEIKTFYSQISDDPNATMPLFYNPRNLLEGNAVLNSIMNAHQNLLRQNLEKPINLRAGASGIIAVRAESVLILVGIGNCCAYHFREGTLTRIISDDSFRFLSKDNFDYKFKSFPMNAMGMYPELGYQMREVRLAQGDKVLLLTDGVHAQVTDEEITYSLSKVARDDQDRINNLLKLSNVRGNIDNLTAMILEF